MNERTFILSGIIETFCLGFTTEEENKLVAAMAAQYPSIAAELAAVKATLQQTIHQQEINPRPSVKRALMQRVYEQRSFILQEFIPLLHKAVAIARLDEVLKANSVPATMAADVALQIIELPSTKDVINLALWVRHKQEEEIHHDFNEYIAVMQGACTMYVDGVPTHYERGEVIVIPPNVLHHSIITSKTPMLALVQRQIFK